MPFWEQSLDHFYDRLATHFWDGKLHWKRQNQLVYPPGEVRSEYIPITAPYICAATPYDNLGFWDFPVRMGWKVHRFDRQCHSEQCPPGICVAPSERSRYGLQTPAVSRVDGNEVSVTEKVAFLQAWLFFGALTEVSSLCGLALDLNDMFVSVDTVSTVGLNGLPLKLFTASQRLRRAGTRELRSQPNALARRVQLIITKAREFEDEHDYTFSECQVLCSIHILLRIILLTFLCHSPQWNVDPKDGMSVSVGDLQYDWAHEGQSRMGELMFTRLVERGWCKSELSGLGYDMVFFAYFVERPEARRIHVNCVETRCMASQTSEETYQTVHVSTDCKCEFISADSERIRDVLSTGKIPKIIISRDLELSVVHEEDYPYVALSHVWADGLGNPFKNALPRCQLQRLRGFVTALSTIHKVSRRHPIALWMDTLCIPVAPHLKEYRKLAIRLLGQTFYDASIVLVLDRELYSVESRKLSDLELGIRVAFSSWMKRLWTLQEAALSIASKASLGKMYFQMGDGPVRWNRILHTFNHMPSKPRSKPPLRPRKPTALTTTVQEIKEGLLFELWVEVSITDHLPSVDDLQQAGFDPQFQRLARAVQNRTTSKSEDEAICLASLAGLDVSSILSVQTAEERMRHFYLLLREIPIAVIFVQLQIFDYTPTQNLKDAPFRWAPASLLLHPTEVMNMHQAYAAQRFAEVEYSTYGICEPDGLHIEHNGFVFQAEMTLSPTCILEDVGSAEQYHLTWYGKPPGDLHRDVALIFETAICSNVAIVHIEERRGGGQDGTEFYAAILGYGSVSTSTQDGLVQGEVMKGILTSLNQKWCLT